MLETPALFKDPERDFEDMLSIGLTMLQAERIYGDRQRIRAARLAVLGLHLALWLVRNPEAASTRRYRRREMRVEDLILSPQKRQELDALRAMA